jgi:tetratricopeptide (TPR) repeat protein
VTWTTKSRSNAFGYMLFGAFQAWRARRRALGDFKRLARAEGEILSLDDHNPLKRAGAALDVGDREAARHYLGLARSRIPAYVQTNPDTVRILLDLGDYDEAEAFTLNGAKRFPGKAHFLEGYARAADFRRDFAESARRWALVRRKFPRSEQGYAFGAAALRVLGELDKTAALIARGRKKLPEALAVLIEYARVAEAQQDWEEAYRRWHAMRDRHVWGYTGGAEALFKLGRRADAEALLQEGHEHYRADAAILRTSARLAEQANETDEAAHRWALVLRRFPYDRAAYDLALRFYRANNRWEEADAAAQEAIQRFSKQDWPLIEHAKLAQQRNDQAVAAERWRVVRTAFPTNREAYRQEAAMLRALGRYEEATQVLAEEQGGLAERAEGPPTHS